MKSGYLACFGSALRSCAATAAVTRRSGLPQLARVLALARRLIAPPLHHFVISKTAQKPSVTIGELTLLDEPHHEAWSVTREQGAFSLGGRTVSKTMLTAAIFGLAAGAAQASDLKRLDQLCKEVGKAEIAKEAASGLERDLRFWTTEGAVVHFSYSPGIDTCVGTRLDYLRNEWNVQDVTEGFMDDHLILHCTKSGAFNVLIDRVKGFGGKIYDKQYDLWADDGDGGPSYAVQTPASAYNRDKCASLFKRKLTELGLVDPQPVDPQ
jgi:hypothetical protein